MSSTTIFINTPLTMRQRWRWGWSSWRGAGRASSVACLTRSLATFSAGAEALLSPHTLPSPDSFSESQWEQSLQTRCGPIVLRITHKNNKQKSIFHWPTMSCPLWSLPSSTAFSHSTCCGFASGLSLLLLQALNYDTWSSTVLNILPQPPLSLSLCFPSFRS